MNEATSISTRTSFGSARAWSLVRIHEQFEWALEGLSLEEGLWFGPGKEVALPSEEIREATRQILLGTRVFILTLGLAEIWVDKVTGRAFWRAVPADLFDETRHAFRISSVEETCESGGLRPSSATFRTPISRSPRFR